MRHPIQHRGLDEEFRGLLREVPRPQRRPKDGLAAKEGGFRQTPPMIARVLFPAPPAPAPDRPQILIPLPGSPCALAMLPDLGIPARRNHRRGPARCQRVVTPPL